ncbi:MAG: lamin tail domain-containing protein [Flavisolibacter sp.]
MKAVTICILLLIYYSSYSQVNQYEIVIDEIMVEPNPTVHLPDAEYIEIKNISGHDIDLYGCQLKTSYYSSVAFPSYFLHSDSFVIITSEQNASLLAPFGQTLGIRSFPPLTNNGTTVSLISSAGSIIHSISYTKDWYHNSSKSNGGWSLEMIDTQKPCIGMDNYAVSRNINGGTPGKKNSIDSILTGQSTFQLVRSYTTDSLTILLSFNSEVDPSQAIKPENYEIQNGPSVLSATVSAQSKWVTLKLSSPLEKKIIYTLTVNSLTNCTGNVLENNSVPTGIAEEPTLHDLVINEILFNPHPYAHDYVELYNRSNIIINAGKLSLANRNSSGAIASIHKLSGEPLFLYPQEYAVITTDKLSLEKEYLVKDPSRVLEVPSMPSYPDDSGTVILLNTQSLPIDEVSYSKSWQFSLISNPEGVALERLDPDKPSQNSTNWHSAASTAGYGTPGYKNSQYNPSEAFSATLTIAPKIFSPDNDGIDDFTSITYQIESIGYLANIYIFDANGRIIRRLVKNDLLGIKGKWTWDGQDEKHQKLPSGIYIIYAELFNLQGKKKIFKSTVTIQK